MITIAKMDLHLHGLEDGWAMFNTLPPEEQTKGEVQMVFNTKGIAQIDNIHKWVESLYKIIDDFSKDQVSEYIKTWKQTCSEVEELQGFDSHRFVTDFLDDETFLTLPNDIAQYREMMVMLNAPQSRKAIRDSLATTFWKDVDLLAELGLPVSPNFESMSPELLAEFHNTKQHRSRLEEIEIQHCLDNYNAWHKELRRMLSERHPFSEIRQLFRD